MKPRTRLPVVRTLQPHLFATAEGDPVWPVRSDAEFAALSRLAKSFGAGLELDLDIAGSGTQPHRSQLVLGLGSETFEAAKLYAHLTGRDVALEQHASEAALTVRTASVIVLLTETLTFELLEQLSARADGEPVPGIIVGENREALHLQVLLRSAAAVLDGASAEERIDISPTLSRSRRRRSARVLEEGATIEAIRDAVRAGAGLLNVMTHSDGVDACFGPTTLCPMESGSTMAPGVSPPPCIVRGYCHRHNMTLAAARAADFLIRPREVAARVVVIHTCKGALLSQSMVDPRWGMVPQLLNQPTIGAVATTWEMTLLVEQDLDRVAAPLERGVPVGEALGQFLDLPAVRARNVRMCLFGDPGVRLPAPSRPSTKASSPKAEVAGDVAFLEAYNHFQRRSPLPQAAALIRKLEKGLRHYAGGKRPAGLASAVETREALLDLICYFGSTPSSDWSQFAKIERSVPSRSPCPQCGTRTQTWIMRILWAKGPQRRMVNCPRCGFVNDSPYGSAHLELRMAGGVLQLAGPLPRANWSARVMIDPGLPTGEEPARRWQNWPADLEGQAVRSLDLGDCLQPWPMNISLFLVEDLALQTLTCRVRAAS
jgi:predicted RNA-binding Zn-ribbon protein involved in translation (DUF1610 family)